MTFLNTTLLALGAGLALGPIIIHLLNRRRYRIIDWAAADFLLESFKKTKRRIRLEQLLLLAMRVAGVGLMGVALARPFVPEQSLAAMLGTQARSDHVIVLDDSYSMGQTLGQQHPLRPRPRHRHANRRPCPARGHFRCSPDLAHSG